MYPIYHNVSALGLLYNSVGILIIGVPSIIIKDKTIQSNVQTYIERNKSFLNYILESNHDIALGSTWLAIGFILQFLTSIQVTLNYTLLNLAWVLLPSIPALYIFRWRKVIIQRKKEQILSAIEQE